MTGGIGPALDSLPTLGARVMLWILSVAMIIVFGFVMVLVLLVIGALQEVRAQEQERGWQLGICVDDPDVSRRCRLVGEPLPDKTLCESLKQSLQAKIVAGKVHCTRVLINAQSSRRSD